MKIAVTYENGQIFQHFGHTEQFKLYEVADGKIVREEVVDTNGSGHGALAGFLMQRGVDTLICGGIGGGAQMALAQSISSRTTENSITFFTTLPYAAIHNDGGEIKVTKKMKRFFWAKYYETSGAFGRKKNGERRNDKRTVQLSTEAEFWKYMALMKEGKSIKIPRRRFLGVSPEVEKAVRDIVEENITEYFNVEFEIKRK